MFLLAPFPSSVFFARILPFILISNILYNSHSLVHQVVPSTSHSPFNLNPGQPVKKCLGKWFLWFILCMLLLRPRSLHLIILMHGSESWILFINTICIRNLPVPKLRSAAGRRNGTPALSRPRVSRPRTWRSWRCFPGPSASDVYSSESAGVCSSKDSWGQKRFFPNQNVAGKKTEHLVIPPRGDRNQDPAGLQSYRFLPLWLQFLDSVCGSFPEVSGMLFDGENPRARSEGQHISSLSFPMPALRSKAMVFILHPYSWGNRTNTLQPAPGMRRFFFPSSSSPRGHFITRYPLAKVPILQQLRISAACFCSVHILSSNLVIPLNNSLDLHGKIFPSVMMNRLYFGPVL